ncbi:TetR/AcrR family transcriptional regulator [Salana multivorans]
MNDDDAPAPVRRTRRHDPDRRDRIIDACLDVIARDGVAGTSHRKVAAAAGVPLGSMTYHFAGMDELLHEAFARFAQGISDDFEHRMAQASDVAAARAAVAAFIIDEGDDGGRGLVLSHELYTLAAREPGFRDLTTAWMERSRAALERHFDPVTARMVDAVIEGFTIHRALDSRDRDPNEVVQAIARITAT